MARILVSEFDLKKELNNRKLGLTEGGVLKIRKKGAL
jgi:hypothetical protein